MSFPPPGAHFLQNLSAMASLMNITNNQYTLTPMGGVIQMPIGMPGLQVPHLPGMQMTMGITVPTGVTTISAPPVRKVTTESQSLLGVQPIPNPIIIPQQQLANQNQASNQPAANKSTVKKVSTGGPTITVFVGNITERASDMLIRQMLSKCGLVNSWKRVQGANGKLQGFGFCEYSDAESAMRAIRLLHEFEIADKKLVVKVDAKTKEKLDNYLKEKNPNSNSESNSIDENTSKEDAELVIHMQNILKEHETELSRDPDPNRAQARRYDKRTGEPTKPENLADMDMEEEKRSLIHREIDKFRDTYKKQDEKDKSESDRGFLKLSSDAKRDHDRNDFRSDDRHFKEETNDSDSLRERRSRVRDRTPLKEKPIKKERDSRYDREMRSEKIEKSVRVDRIDRNDDKNSVASDRVVEDEEEIYERRRLERKMREKEASYQERLRNWEQREARKMKEYHKYKTKQELKKDEEIKEVKRLKQFLEDYDDDRDDCKFYKSSALIRRLREREKEKEEDSRDRRQEKRELEDLRRKLIDEGHPDPDGEARKRLNSIENDREREKIVSAKIKELMNEARSRSKKIEEENNILTGAEANGKGEMHVKSFTFTGFNKMSHSGNSNSSQINSPKQDGSSTLRTSEKRKKLSVKDVFNPNDDEDGNEKNKRRKFLSLNDDNGDSNQSFSSSNVKNNLGETSGGGSGNGNENTAKSNLSTEEKRKQIKCLIEKIPTSKEELFNYNIDWNFVDNNLMEKRIRPWVNKKITEYIGEEEQALLDFICNKLQTKSSAQSILDDVVMVLDDEAEAFVVKMWRLLIYEIEAKKLGLGK